MALRSPRLLVRFAHLCLLALLASAGALAQIPPRPESPPDLFDPGKVIQPPHRKQIERLLQESREQHQTPLLLVVLHNKDHYESGDSSELAVLWYRKWMSGRPNSERGLVLLADLPRRAVFMHAGKAWSAQQPQHDALIKNTIIPGLQRQGLSAGLLKATEELHGLAQQSPVTPATPEQVAPKPGSVKVEIHWKNLALLGLVTGLPVLLIVLAFTTKNSQVKIVNLGSLQLRLSAVRVLFLLIFEAVAVGFVCLALNLVYEGWQSTRWPAVEGEIVSSEIAFSQSNSSTTSNRATPYAKIEYRYEVDGKSYRGDQVDFRAWSRRTSQVEQLLQRFPRGPARVYFDPDQPDTAVLAPGVSWFGVGLSLLAALVFGAGGLMAPFAKGKL